MEIVKGIGAELFPRNVSVSMVSGVASLFLHLRLCVCVGSSRQKFAWLVSQRSQLWDFTRFILSLLSNSPISAFYLYSFFSSTHPRLILLFC